MCFYWMGGNVCAASSYSHTVVVFRKRTEGWRMLPNVLQRLSLNMNIHNFHTSSYLAEVKKLRVHKGGLIPLTRFSLSLQSVTGEVWGVQWEHPSSQPEQGVAASRLAVTPHFSGDLAHLVLHTIVCYPHTALPSWYFTFVLKAKLNEIRIIYELNSRLSFLKTMG